MRKAVFFHNEASRLIGKLIVLLLLLFQSAVAQTEGEGATFGSYQREVYTEINMKLTEGSISCPSNLRAVIFNPDSFRVNDEDSFYNAIEWWWVQNEGEGVSKASERQFTPKTSPIPIKN